MFCRTIFFGLLTVAALAFPERALAEKGKLRERLTPEVMAVVFPGAERLGTEEGSPPAIAVYRNDKIAAYVFSTLDIIAPRGYSTTPFDVIGGVDVDGRITGAKVVFHTEPEIIHDPIRQRLLDTLLSREAGRPLRGGTNALPPDYVAGATISARAMRAAVLTTAGLVFRTRAPRIAGAVAAAAPSAAEAFSLIPWDVLVQEGVVVHRRVTSGEIAEAFGAAGVADPKLEVPIRKSDDVYIDFSTALFSMPAIGGNLVGLLNYEDYKRQLEDGAQTIFVASSGPYDFLGTKYFRDAEGHKFDRLRVVQDDRVFEFVQDDYRWINPYGEGIKGQENAAVFTLHAGSGFDPMKPWRLEMRVSSAAVPPATVGFGLDYKAPDPQVLANLGEAAAARRAESAAAAAAAVQTSAVDVKDGANQVFEAADAMPPAWVEAWSDSRLNIGILAAMLTVLTLIFAFQSRLARYRLGHRLVRNGFLLVTLVWLGWTAGVQLSTVNVMNYLRAPFIGLDAGFYLSEPLMVIIAGYTLVSVLLIGRGVFCGWLCPFGALQELLGQCSRALGVPQWNPPAALEHRLWWGKYVSAAVVLVLVMSEIDPSGAVAEVEPFKTAIISKFARSWPYVVYAGILLTAGLFSERAYCRFLCPLGGVLATLDRLHLLNLLKRRPECGSPCHLCERSCPVRAIEKTGRIVTAECFQCLDCQVEYYDDQRCPPLVRAARGRGGEGKKIAAAAAEAL